MFSQRKPIAPLSFLDVTPANAQDLKTSQLILLSTFVRPTLEYASIIWDPTTKQNVNKPVDNGAEASCQICT